MNILALLPVAYALYLNWWGGLEPFRYTRDLPTRYFSTDNSASRVGIAISWQTRLEHMSISVFISLITSVSLALQDGKSILAAGLVLLGVVFFDLMRRLRRRWARLNPEGSLRFAGVMLVRLTWAKLITTGLILIPVIVATTASLF